MFLSTKTGQDKHLHSSPKTCLEKKSVSTSSSCLCGMERVLNSHCDTQTGVIWYAWPFEPSLMGELCEHYNRVNARLK